jgi:phosphoribosylaminoimidazole-succinocarboxamide synthase
MEKISRKDEKIMLQVKTIKKAIPNVLKTVSLSGLGKKYQGKVRDYYIQDKKRILITTDRQSAFDVNLGFIPYKGAVLNLLSAFWFSKTNKIIPNHLVSVPDPNIMITRNCDPIPIEMIVRGYISGITKTSIWYSYERGERFIYGIRLPDGLQKNQRLLQPIITPTTHGGGKGGHDERLTRTEIISRKIVSQKLYQQMEKVALDLFDYGSKWCIKHGLILVDTKYEFGLFNGKLMLMDEIHTPDSSRFWISRTYKNRFRKGIEPENYDKEFLRLWYVRHGYQGDGIPPKMTTSLTVALSRRYISVYEKISGSKFPPIKYPRDATIVKVIDHLS